MAIAVDYVPARLLSRQEAADFLGVRPQTLAVWASTGRHSLRFIKVGRLVKYRLDELEAFLQSHSGTSTGEIESR